ncbi:CPBP family intramembrane glutamic endopeptidase [Streptoverticillium reticulum]|uniref:CPBP family intramembrane glutamic endopeptidase n=1 Tax=Streptoverticillium reticulum TaxID=1433415 RepID=UPI0039BF5FC6
MLETKKKQQQAVPPTADAPKAKGTVWFLVIAFGGSWACILIAYFGCGLSMVNPLAQLPFGIMPALAAIVVRRWITKEGFADAGLALRLRGAWPYYLAAWLGPLVLAAASCGVAAALGLWHPDLSALDELAGGMPAWVFVLALMLVVPLLTPVYAGEEFGWTGYLRQRLFPGRPALATAVTGLVWASWHYPLALTDYISFPRLLIGLTVWTGSFLLQEVLLAWLFTRSRSIWTVSLAHGGNNMVLSLLTGTLLGSEAGTGTGGGLDVTGVALMTVVPMAVACACVMFPSRRGSKGRGRAGGGALS